MNSFKLSFFIALSLLFQTAATAQEWVSYESQQQVNDLVETDDELFLATDAGLVVVDKVTLEKAFFNTGNSNLSNNHIQTITKAANGDIWIGTYDVVMARFSGSGFEETTIVNDPAVDDNTELYDFQIAPNGDFWLGTNDGVFQREGQDWTLYDNDDLGPTFFEAWDIAINDAGEVFMASFDVHQFSNGVWSNLTEGSDLNGYLGADLFFATNGDLFFAGDLDEIGRFDGQVWQRYPIDLNGSEVIRFAEDLDGNIYFNTQQDGIFTLENGAWVQQSNQQAIAFNNITPYFHIDEQGNEWMNSNIRLSVNKDGDIESTLIAEHTLETNTTNTIQMGQNEKMYFITGSRENISVVDADGNWSFLAKPAMAVPFEFLNDILVIADDDIYIAAQSGLYHFNGSEWTLRDLGVCRSLAVNGQGVVIYIRADDRIYLLENEVISEYNVNNSPITSLLLSGMSIDIADNLWIASGSFDGENVIQNVSPTGDWTTYTSMDHPAIERPLGDFQFAPNGDVWIPNDNIGALRFDGTSWSNPYIGNLDQMASFQVDDIEIDPLGKVYLSHDFGVTTFMEGDWEDRLIEDVPQQDISSSTSISFDSDYNLWWGSQRYGVFLNLIEGVSDVRSNDEDIAANFSVFPNPANNYATISFTLSGNTAVQAFIYNQLGQLQSSLNLGQLPTGTFQQAVDLTQLPKGFYTIQLQLGDKSSAKTIIVQ